MKRYKKIYVEILNYCNLNCSFCVKNNRLKRSMNINEFQIVINKIKNYTDYLYLHVQGEPLLHPNLKEFLDIALDNHLYIHLTTNGTLIKNNFELLHHPAIRQINISLQALTNLNQKNEYYESIVDLLKSNNHPYISLRVWGDLDEEYSKVIKYFEDKLFVTYDFKKKSLLDKVFISKENSFTWPDINHPVNDKKTTCLATSQQLAILVDGTIVPCCLDKDGVIDLGNIFTDDLQKIITSERYQKMIIGFKSNLPCEELCKKCTYRLRFK